MKHSQWSAGRSLPVKLALLILSTVLIGSFVFYNIAHAQQFTGSTDTHKFLRPQFPYDINENEDSNTVYSIDNSTHNISEVTSLPPKDTPYNYLVVSANQQ